MRTLATLVACAACAAPTPVEIADPGRGDGERVYELLVCRAGATTCEEVAAGTLPDDCVYDQRVEDGAAAIGQLDETPYLFIATARRPADCELLGLACARVDGRSHDALVLTLEPASGACASGDVCDGDGMCSADADAGRPDAGRDGAVPNTGLNAGPPDGGCDPCGAIDVAAGAQHSCAVRWDGHVFCWGDNASGQLGAPMGIASSATPREVDGLDGFDAIDVEAGSDFSCARDASSVRCWGSDESGQLGDSGVIGSTQYAAVAVADVTDAVELAAGWIHACARLRGGEVWCWGHNQSGELGRGPGETRISISTPAAVPGLAGAIAIAAGDGQTCAVLMPTGDLRCWGFNYQGAVGTGEATTSYSSPQAIAPLTALIDVAAGGAPDLFGTNHAAHTCAIGTGASCWGRNDHGQLGNDDLGTPRDAPVAVTGGHVFTAIAAGGHHTCGVRTDGALYCWGANASGELGITPSIDSDQPALVTGLPSVDQVSLGTAHTCARAGARIFCWGDGNATPTEIFLP